MKKAKWIYIVLILLSGAVFIGYRFAEQLRADTRAPEVTVSGPLSVSVYDSDEALLAGVTAKDDRDGDVTASLVVESMTMTDRESPVKVVYAAFDKAGNVAKAERDVTLTDYTSPKFSLKSALAFSAGSNFDVMNLVEAEDVLDGDITRRVRATMVSENAITMQGLHEVEFRVTNSLGDTVRTILPVEVYPANTYKASLRLTDYLIYLPQGAAFNARDYLLEYTLLNEQYWLRGSIPAGITVKTEGLVDTSVPGVYAVSYTVTGELREEPYAAYSKLIVIVEG